MILGVSRADLVHQVLLRQCKGTHLDDFFLPEPVGMVVSELRPGTSSANCPVLLASVYGL